MWKVQVLRETRKGISVVEEKRVSNPWMGRQHVVKETGYEAEAGLGWWRLSLVTSVRGELECRHWYVVPASWTLQS